MSSSSHQHVLSQEESQVSHTKSLVFDDGSFDDFHSNAGTESNMYTSKTLTFPILCPDPYIAMLQWSCVLSIA